ncbi:hypothetical protein F4806DRAFT_385689 [Annulohypoxylon nitens]|nr:hypothetical protein F4806DRAFT_385689 [Annulohypoxylon nitens]
MLSRTTRHIAPLRTFAARQPSLAQSAQLQRTWSRFSSQSQQPSPNSQFYKTFGRPIAKVFLLAIFSYQLAYYFWVRLETDERKSELRATITELEARIDRLEKARKT